MTTQLIPFQFETLPVRVVIQDSNPWWIAADICAVLEIGNSRMALSRLDDDEKGVSSIDTLGGKQDMATINEFGLYSLILGSRKPEAKAFKRWITHEVIPTIRATGSFSLAPRPLSVSTKMRIDINRQASCLASNLANVAHDDYRNTMLREAQTNPAFNPFLWKPVDRVLASMNPPDVRALSVAVREQERKERQAKPEYIKRRNYQMLTLRLEGKSYREIGKITGVSHTCAFLTINRQTDQAGGL